MADQSSVTALGETTGTREMSPAEERDFRESAGRFFEREMQPVVEEAEATGRMSKDLVQRAGEAGFLGIRYPASIGGSGGDIVAECIWIEESARVCCGLTSALMIQSGLGTSPIFAHGTQKQIERYVIPAIKGQLLSAFALSEPSAGSDVLSIRTTAVREGDTYIINGQKMFITNSPVCDYMILAAYTNREARGHGISLFIVDADTPGIEVRSLKKHGHWSAETGEVVLQDVSIPASHLIGEENAGYRYLLEGLEGGRISHAARSLGVARAAFEATVRYVKEREAFGRAIGDFQSMRFRIAKMATDVESIRLHTYSAAHMHARGEPAKAASSMAKMVAADLAVDITVAAMRAHGGYGFMREFPVERYHRDAMLFPVSEGTNDIQLEIIARTLT